MRSGPALRLAPKVVLVHTTEADSLLVSRTTSTITPKGWADFGLASSRSSFLRKCLLGPPPERMWKVPYEYDKSNSISFFGDAIICDER